MTKQVKAVLTAAELEQLAQAIGEAEKETSGELRLMIVERSTIANHVEPLLWLLLVSLGLIALWVERMNPLVEAWGDWLVPAVLGLSAVLALPLARLPFLRRWLVTPADRRQAVWTRAELEFYREGLTATKGGTGILLFLSLFERQAIVLADRAIAAHVPKSIWDDVVGLIVKGAGTNALATQLESAIKLCGEHLRAHFPAEAGKTNELSNAVILK